MNNDIFESNLEKFHKSFEHFESIVLKAPKFDSSIAYSSEELEIFDALTSRFVRLYETTIQLFRTIDSLQSMHISESFGELITNMLKLNVIVNDEIWFEMRMIRNKISHDYLPAQLQMMITLITNKFYPEFGKVRKRFIKA